MNIITAISNSPWYIQLVLMILAFGIVAIIGYIAILIVRKGFKFKNISLGSGYLTGEQIIRLVEKEVDTKIEQMTIELKKRPRDQMLYVEQCCMNIKEIMMKNYKKLLNDKQLSDDQLKEVYKAYEMMTKIILQEQKDICLQYFANINGSLNDVPMIEVTNPESQLNKSITTYSMWMIKKASEAINDWYLELNTGINREQLHNDNLPIVPNILKNIQDALKTGHKIHIQYLDKIKVGEQNLKQFREELLKTS